MSSDEVKADAAPSVYPKDFPATIGQIPLENTSLALGKARLLIAEG